MNIAGRLWGTLANEFSVGLVRHEDKCHVVHKTDPSGSFECNIRGWVVLTLQQNPFVRISRGGHQGAGRGICDSVVRRTKRPQVEEEIEDPVVVYHVWALVFAHSLAVLLLSGSNSEQLRWSITGHGETITAEFAEADTGNAIVVPGTPILVEHVRVPVVLEQGWRSGESLICVVLGSRTEEGGLGYGERAGRGRSRR